MGLGIEGADAVDLVIEQIDTIGGAAAHRKQVQQGTPYRELTMGQNLRDTLVAATLQLPPGLLQIHALANLHQQGMGFEKTARRQPLHQGRDRYDQDAPVHARQPVEGQQALRDQLRQWREDVVGQGLPIRKTDHWQ